MRFSLVAFAGLAVFSGNFGVNARALPNELVQRTPGSLSPRAGVTPPKIIIPAPKPPGTVKPETNAPKPETIAPEPETIAPGTLKPEIVTPEGAGSPTSETEYLSDSDDYMDPSPPQSPIKDTPFNFKTLTVKIDINAGTDDNPCGVSVGGLKKREPVAPDSPLGWAKLYQWLKDYSNVDPTKIVFYTGAEGQAMALNFINNNPEDGYRYWWDIFNGKNALTLSEHLKGSGLTLGDLTQSEASKALASFAKDPIVFNSDNAKDSSYWLNYEKPRMWAAGEITKMKDWATKRSETAGKIALPASPKDGNALGC